MCGDFHGIFVLRLAVTAIYAFVLRGVVLRVSEFLLYAADGAADGQRENLHGIISGRLEHGLRRGLESLLRSSEIPSLERLRNLQVESVFLARSRSPLFLLRLRGLTCGEISEPAPGPPPPLALVRLLLHGRVLRRFL